MPFFFFFISPPTLLPLLPSATPWPPSPSVASRYNIEYH
ncbi:hypothetical protein GLYMA_15G265450v4 [Glycine max]|nr:hypothetical protein GLYMA_15G265450v4 [Glycine max]KAH1148966.1 hypothetical protein GYH30_043549 [Glycine max]